MALRDWAKYFRPTSKGHLFCFCLSTFKYVFISALTALAAAESSARFNVDEARPQAISGLFESNQSGLVQAQRARRLKHNLPALET
jgi:hypothetical protein